MQVPGSAAQLGRQLATGELSSADLVAACLQRIRAVDPVVNAVLSLNPRAREDARRSDRRRAAGPARPLEGVPVLIKDNIAVAGLPTSAGSRALARTRPRSARLVRRLEAAGAVVLGKTNLSEWGNVRSPRSTSGWSGLGGQTRNPYVLDRSPSGSSSGSAAALAAGLAPLAVGTETDGSIISPAGSCGVVGFKPTVGTIPSDGIIPVWTAQDAAGPLATTVRDAAALFAALTGRGQVSLSPDVLRDVRLGLWVPADADAASQAVLTESAAALAGAGAVVVPVQPGFEGLLDFDHTEALRGFREGLDRYLSVAPGSAVRSLAELVEFNRRDEIELTHFGQEYFELALAMGGVPQRSAAMHHLLRRARARGAIDRLLGADHLGAIVTLSNGPAPLIDYAVGDAPELRTTSPAATAGYPTLSVPAGYVGALPIGVSFIGTGGSDDLLLRLGHAFEQVTRARREPQFLTTADTSSVAALDSGLSGARAG